MDIVGLLSWGSLFISVIASIVFLLKKRNATPNKRLLVVAAYNFFCGLLVLLLSSFHFIVISSEIFSGKTLNNGSAFHYNFRFFSLLLLGCILAVLAYKLLRCTIGILNQNGNDVKSAINTVLLLLLINLPLSPIQGFAVAFVIVLYSQFAFIISNPLATSNPQTF